jgi:hypothetical protein
MHCTHSTFSPCCAPGRATNPWIHCIAWGIFPIFAQTRATNPAIRCIAWGIFPIFALTRATNPAIRCIVAHTAHFCRLLPLSARRIREFVAPRTQPIFVDFCPYLRDESVNSSRDECRFPGFCRFQRDESPAMATVPRATSTEFAIWASAGVICSEEGAIAVRADIVRIWVARSSRSGRHGMAREHVHVIYMSPAILQAEGLIVLSPGRAGLAGDALGIDRPIFLLSLKG